LLIGDFHFFVQDHGVFHLNDDEFLNFLLNLVGAFLEHQLMPIENDAVCFLAKDIQ
jgi:hypothetical protein